MRFTSILSDLDGVLVDSATATSLAWATWGKRHGLDGVSIQAANHGRPAHAVIGAYVAAADLYAESAFLLEAEMATASTVAAFSGASQVLAFPSVAVVTSCVATLADARLRAAGLTAPNVIVSSGEVTHGKPAPDAYLLGAQRLSADPSTCLVLEDAPAGIAAGKAAGMAVWSVTTTHPVGELRSADRIFGSLGDLVEALERLR